jgi:hypothetical protein
MLVEGLNFQLSCTAFTVDEGVINATTAAKAVLLFKGCTTLDFTTKAEIPCEVVEPIRSEFEFLPAELTDNKPALLVERTKGLLKLTKVGELTKPCTLPEDNTVTGEFCFKIIDGTNDTVKPIVETSTLCKKRNVLEGTEVTSGGIPDLLKYGGQDGTLHLKATLFLEGAHKGLTLGVSLF